MKLIYIDNSALPWSLVDLFYATVSRPYSLIGPNSTILIGRNEASMIGANEDIAAQT